MMPYRRLAVRWCRVALFVDLLLWTAPRAVLAAEGTTLAVRDIDSIGITVDDLDRSADFFANVLDFEEVDRAERSGEQFEQECGVFGARARVARLRLGDEVVELTDFLTPRGRDMPHDSRSNDRWFQHIAIVVRDMDQAYRRLRECNVEHASTGPQRLPELNTQAAGIRAFYFRDPDGHFLEILQFPPGKGNSKWHAPTERLFLGLDHTAIVVQDTETSLRYYRDRLGLKIVGESENHGTEQEHLNNVFGARLRITSLRAASGPGVELLEYLAPRDGGPSPRDSRSNDLWHWRINARKSEPNKAHDGLPARLTDPDGHVLMFTTSQPK